jgi:hypothetical protein
MFQTRGMNPNHSTPDEILKTVNELKAQLPFSPDQIFFYGSGCSHPDKQDLIKKILQSPDIFPQSKIQVSHDMLGAARALLHHESGIACILGTGSHAGLYDGSQIVRSPVSLGYLGGDEGSAFHLGLLLVRAYCYHQLPDKVEKKFLEFCKLTPENLVRELYSSPHPNEFLAQYAKFYTWNGLGFQDFQYLNELSKEAFRSFFRQMLIPLQSERALPVNFIGSVAWHFKNQIHEVLDEFGWPGGKILLQPIEELARYHGVMSS